MPKQKKFLSARIQKTSFCPRCGKRFSSDTRVLQHMNQPSSVCGTFLHDISGSQSRPSSQTIQRAEPLGHNTHDPRQPASLESADSPPYVDDDPMDIEWNDDHLDLPPAPSDSGESPGNVEEFPGAARCFPHGSTFMDQFFSDEYGELRKENLYYPFASQQDWQLASWLLRSRLSMAAIDSFLSLQLVSDFNWHLLLTTDG